MEKHLKGKKITALMGMMADKDIDKVLYLLLPYFKNVYTVTPANPRAMDSKELCEKIKRLGTFAESFDDIRTAIEYALRNLTNENVLIVCGSLYLCSDVYNIIKSSS